MVGLLGDAVPRWLLIQRQAEERETWRKIHLSPAGLDLGKPLLPPRIRPRAESTKKKKKRCRNVRQQMSTSWVVF